MDRQKVARILVALAKRVAVSPPGWKKTVEKMKEHPEIDNPWALSWWMEGEGYEPHYRKAGKRVRLTRRMASNDKTLKELTKRLYPEFMDYLKEYSKKLKPDEIENFVPSSDTWNKIKKIMDDWTDIAEQDEENEKLLAAVDKVLDLIG